MTSESDFIASLVSAEMYLYRIGGPVLIFIGSISCILSLIIFTKKNLRKSPCSIYLIAFNVVNLLLIYTSALFGILSAGYNVNASVHNLGLCRYVAYAGILFDILSPFYLILASLDRVLVTSRNAGTRRRSTHRLAYIFIISGTIFWVLFHSHAFIFSKIIEIASNYFICYYDSKTYLVFISCCSLIVKAILVPSVMLVLGWWTIKNIRSMKRARVVPVFSITAPPSTAGMHSSHSKDRQLVKMLFMNISIYITFDWFVSIILIYQQITQYRTKSLVQMQIDTLLLNVGFFGSYIPFCVGCFTNLLVSKTFRNEIKNVLLCK